jgi:succinate dehydrogenase/fumarate reductase-like Fe-S protein
MPELVHLTVGGKALVVPPAITIVQAIHTAGEDLSDNVGCMGQGVCGSCRCMVVRRDSGSVTFELACETLVEDGMQVNFVDYLEPALRRQYPVDTTDDEQRRVRLDQIFPEAKHCRHCGGCDDICPRDIEVEQLVNLAVEGKFSEASRLFDYCVMCNLCTLTCPENIAPNHVGLYARRAVAATQSSSTDLRLRLGELAISASDFDPFESDHNDGSSAGSA